MENSRATALPPAPWAGPEGRVSLSLLSVSLSVPHGEAISQGGQGTEHTDGFASSQEVLEQNPPKQNSFEANIFLLCPCCPEITQVCCCLHNLGEETEPLLAETSAPKPVAGQILPAGFPFPCPLWARTPWKVLG